MRFDPGRRRPESKRIASKQSRHPAGRTGLALASKCPAAEINMPFVAIYIARCLGAKSGASAHFLKLLQGIPRPRLSITRSDAELTSTLRCRRTVSVCTFRNAQSATLILTPMLDGGIG